MSRSHRTVNPSLLSPIEILPYLVEADHNFDRGTMRVLINVMVLSLTLGGVGCVLFLAKETRYLLSAADRATQEDVRQHLGQPLRVTSHQTGEAVWAYRVRERVEGGNNAWTMVGVWWCDNYTLTFDAQGILRHWTHTSQRCG